MVGGVRMNPSHPRPRLSRGAVLALTFLVWLAWWNTAFAQTRDLSTSQWNQAVRDGRIVEGQVVSVEGRRAYSAEKTVYLQRCLGAFRLSDASQDSALKGARVRIRGTVVAARKGNSGPIIRVDRLDELIAAQVPQWKLYPAVQALMCLRGVQLTAATVLVAELGDMHRFAHPRHLMAFLGLVPREHTTGESRQLGSITKTGNAHARWTLGEIVQHAFLPPKVSAPLALRQRGQPVAYKEIGWRMQTRLHKRGRHLLGRGVRLALLQDGLQVGEHLPEDGNGRLVHGEVHGSFLSRFRSALQAAADRGRAAGILAAILGGVLSGRAKQGQIFVAEVVLAVGVREARKVPKSPTGGDIGRAAR